MGRRGYIGFVWWAQVEHGVRSWLEKFHSAVRIRTESTTNRPHSVMLPSPLRRRCGSRGVFGPLEWQGGAGWGDSYGRPRLRCDRRAWL